MNKIIKHPYSVKTIPVTGDNELMAEMLTEIQRLEEAIQRVRELHKPCDCRDDYPLLDGVCNVCMDCDEQHPCPTIKALDGEQ